MDKQKIGGVEISLRTETELSGEMDELNIRKTSRSLFGVGGDNQKEQNQRKSKNNSILVIKSFMQTDLKVMS